MTAKYVLVLATGLSLSVLGCKNSSDRHDKAGHSHDGRTTKSDGKTADTKAPANARTAVARLTPSKNATTQPAVRNVAGEVTFTESAKGIKVVAHVTGLEPNKKHGFHIHQKGDISAPDLSSAGDHFDPEATGKHGSPDKAGHVHAGDLGNLQANDKGIATLEMDVPGLVMTGDKGIVGRSVIVHANADDLKSQPSGASGARIAGGKIDLKP